MGHPWDKDEFASWVRALAAGELTKEQIDTLDAMVASGEAKSRKDAAERLFDLLPSFAVWFAGAAILYPVHSALT